jgi:hypothetical protein
MKHTDRLLNGTVVLVVLITLARAFELPQMIRRPAKIKPGVRVEQKVTGGGLERAAGLSDVKPGKCRFLVIYSPTCGACLALAHQWKQDLRGDESPFPAGWEVAWVSSQDSAFSARLQPPGAPVANLFASAGVSWVESVGITGYPSHVILDRDGRIVSGGLGGFLSPKESYKSDCTVTSANAERASS